LDVGRKVVRRFTALVIILPLATALAAGAGDGIKWERSEAVTRGIIRSRFRNPLVGKIIRGFYASF
jgi:hypothetical protein